ncbi:MAG: M23 family metallopeptidase [Sphingomonadaceae bacterium]|nr:M23 family metallopeptidase [Sphingomonadaceae bacterium]
MLRRQPATASLVALLTLAACAREVPRPAVSVAAAPAAPPAATPPPVRPPWTARKVVTDAVAVPGGRQHTVKAGETGIAIARAYGVPWSTVVAANHLTPPYRLEIGDRLLLPSRSAVAAQTPEERARAFNIDIDDLISGAEPAGGGPVPKARPRTPARPPVHTAEATPPVHSADTSRPAARPLPAVTGPAPAFAWPLEGRVLSGFGPKAGGRFNDGVNLKASVGTPVRAAADGVVAYAGDAVAGFGNLVLIKHADGWTSAYGHNETLLVQRGQKVAKGDIIARSGATGAVDEPQLHFELRRGLTPSDPLALLPRRS